MEQSTPTQVAAEPDNSVPAQTTEGDKPKEVDWEKRYKDTQKSIEKRSIENKQLKAENDALAKQLSEITTSPIEVPEAIEELKYSNPEKWRSEINKLEQEAKLKDADARKEVLANVSKEAGDQFELNRRELVFKDFQAANPDLEINDQVLASDIPPRISNKLADGTTTFEEFLDEVKTFLSAGKKPSNQPVMQEPNLGAHAGGEQPSMEARNGDSKVSYKNEIY